MKNVSQAVLDAFKPTVLLTPAAQEHTSRHADFLHSAAVAKLGEHSFMLQHHTLTFVTDLLSAEPVTLEHLRAQSMWELAYGHQFFFWGCLSQSGMQNGTLL